MSNISTFDQAAGVSADADETSEKISAALASADISGQLVQIVGQPVEVLSTLNTQVDNVTSGLESIKDFLSEAQERFAAVMDSGAQIVARIAEAADDTETLTTQTGEVKQTITDLLAKAEAFKTAAQDLVTQAEELGTDAEAAQINVHSLSAGLETLTNKLADLHQN